MPKHILLTGSTGFVGKQLLRLLVQQGHHVYILVRHKLGKSPAARLEQLLDGADAKQVTVIPGDLAQPEAGISADDLARLDNRIDTVIHSAALVRFDEELADELEQVNVEGTRSLLALAKRIRARRFYQVSTAYTCGLQEVAREELHPLTGPFHNPYERTKCHAEHLVMQAAADEFHTAIFRPSVIIGDSRTGLADTALTIYGFIRGIRVFARKIKKALPNQRFRIAADPLATQNVVPVDYVCQAIAAAVHQEVQGGIYHLTNPNPPTNRQVFSSILRRLSLNPDFIHIDKHLRDEEMAPEETLLNELVATYRVYLYHYAAFEDRNTRALLRQQGLPALSLDERQLDFILGVYADSLTPAKNKITV